LEDIGDWLDIGDWAGHCVARTITRAQAGSAWALVCNMGQDFKLRFQRFDVFLRKLDDNDQTNGYKICSFHPILLKFEMEV